ncbi:hypothetical protein [Agreia sp. VKM Ac-1783]|uniref:hypothetical protein n=1 Tax=Agreia sp. VKM Ac-1783 TaxID=1938889 RepID=UPI000A2ABA26|nr:hypothetical protein [Agreia sp. VKM Ac-1783]SMQ74995.1 hypothetical protein SAMN06295943_3395 [Agreia sp. VKM Ac-1783]
MSTVARYGRTQKRGLDRRFWPRDAQALGDDIRVVGESMVGMARAVGTPCTRVVEAIDRGESAIDREGESQRFCAVVVAAVELVTPSSDGAGADIWLDAELDGCEPVAEAVRLIGRRSSDAQCAFTLRPTPRRGELRATLPADIRAGDLLAFVVEQPVALHDIRRRSWHRERLI